uniref:Uncharacterized protein n=1 Tax=viral metagenome TaxID=1070528 RepID=A0A6C0EA53_9ZZZZ
MPAVPADLLKRKKEFNDKLERIKRELEAKQTGGKTNNITLEAAMKNSFAIMEKSLAKKV